MTLDLKKLRVVFREIFTIFSWEKAEWTFFYKIWNTGEISVNRLRECDMTCPRSKCQNSNSENPYL